MAFHVNPKTGNPGLCRAEKGGCPFGGESEHFENKEEARSAYEAKQQEIEHFTWKSIVPPTKGAQILSVYDPMSEKIGVGELWGNPVFAEFTKKLEEALNFSRLVLETGQVFRKESTYGNQELWRYVEGPPGFVARERGSTTDIGFISPDIMAKGARLEVGGEDPKVPLEHRLDAYPYKEELEEEAEDIAETFNGDIGAGDPETLDQHLDDHIATRWSGLTPKQWGPIRESLKELLGEQRNRGTEDDPSWGWSR